MAVVAAESKTVVRPVLKTVGAVHLRQQGLHLRLGLVARIEEPAMGLWMLLPLAWYSHSLVLRLKRIDGEQCSVLVNGLSCLHYHREQE